MNVETKKTQNPYNTVDLQRIGLWVCTLALVINSIRLFVIGEFPRVIVAGTITMPIIFSAGPVCLSRGACNEL